MISFPTIRKLLYMLALLFTSPGTGGAQQGGRELMADAMSRMMEAMGMFDSAPSERNWGSSAQGMPWGSPVQDPSRAFAMRELMDQFRRQMTRPGGGSAGMPGPWTSSRLEGVWEGRGGELLIVQGDRFRIYSPQMQPLDGLMHMQGNRLALYSPQDGHARPFEFAESQGRLVLRDLGGQMYLYRRIRLDGG